MTIFSEKLKKLRKILESMHNQDSAEYDVDAVIVEAGSELNEILEEMIKREGSHLIVENEKYKRFGKSKEITYRIDKGDNTPGHQTHVHVFAKGNQLYAINMDGTPHDGSKAQLSKKAIQTLKSLGVRPPEDGLLEWKSFSGDTKLLLLD